MKPNRIRAAVGVLFLAACVAVTPALAEVHPAVAQPNVRWAYNLPAAEVQNSNNGIVAATEPVDGVVLAATPNNVLFLDVATGVVKTTAQLPVDCRSDPDPPYVVTAHSVFVITCNQAMLAGYNSSGAMLWRHQTTLTIATQTPWVLENGNVLVETESAHAPLLVVEPVSGNVTAISVTPGSTQVSEMFIGLTGVGFHLTLGFETFNSYASNGTLLFNVTVPQGSSNVMLAVQGTADGSVVRVQLNQNTGAHTAELITAAGPGWKTTLMTLPDSHIHTSKEERLLTSLSTDGTVIAFALTAGDSVHGVRVSDGKPLWRLSSEKFGWSSISALGTSPGCVLLDGVVGRTGSVVCVAPATGTALFNISYAVSLAATSSDSDGAARTITGHSAGGPYADITFVTTNTQVFAVSRATGEALWTAAPPDSNTKHQLQPAVPFPVGHRASSVKGEVPWVVLVAPVQGSTLTALDLPTAAGR